jgi:hypothetical protein
VGIKGGNNRVLANRCDFTQHHFSYLNTRAGVDHHDATVDEHETGVVGECLVGAVWIFIGTVDDVDVVSDLRQGIFALDRRCLCVAAGKQEQD